MGTSETDVPRKTGMEEGERTHVHEEPECRQSERKGLKKKSSRRNKGATFSGENKALPSPVKTFKTKPNQHFSTPLQFLKLSRGRSPSSPFTHKQLWLCKYVSCREKERWQPKERTIPLISGMKKDTNNSNVLQSLQ